MSDTLKDDLLEALDIADRFDQALTTEKKEELRARLQSATITEPPPPDPCVVQCGLVETRRVGDWLVIGKYAHGDINLTYHQAAALVPALQAFVAEGEPKANPTPPTDAELLDALRRELGPAAEITFSTRGLAGRDASVTVVTKGVPYGEKVFGFQSTESQVWVFDLDRLRAPDGPRKTADALRWLAQSGEGE